MIIDNFQIFILYFNYQLSIYEVYNIKSRQAEEFINHQEILDTLEYAQVNRNNRPLIESLIDKAALCQGLSHREAALLLECDEPELVQRIYHLAREIKRKFYGNRIVMFAPLYLSNYCVNGCVYCPYHAKTVPSPARNSRKRRYAARLSPCRTWGINAWRWKPEKTLETTLSTIS